MARTADHYPELAELVAYHRVRASELDPAPERRREAYRATVEAAGIVAERAAVARAQELYEHAAELAGDTEERPCALRAAGGVAMRQFRGDQALKLRKREAEIAEAAGLRDAAASAYAIAVSIPARMGGSPARRRGGDGRDASPRSRACVAGRPRGTDPVDPRRGVDRLAARPWTRWKSRLARARAPAQDRRSGADLERARCDLVAQLARWPVPRRTREHHAAPRDPRSAGGADSEIEYEIEDEVGHMATETLLQIGRLREAAATAARQRERDLARGVTHMAWLRGLLVSFLLGEWDETLEFVKRGREAWLEVGRPALSAMSTGLASAGAIHGYRGRYDEADDAFDFAEGFDARFRETETRPHGAAGGCVAAPRLHGRGGRAAAGLGAGALGVVDRAAARRGQSLVLAGDPEAGDAIAPPRRSLPNTRWRGRSRCARRGS